MKHIKILFLTSEVAPFAKTSSLGDVAGAFPVALKDLGHETRVIMPKYKIINERKYVLREVIRLREIEIPLGNEAKRINVKSAFIPDTKVQIYFIDYKPFFSRDGLYVDSKSGKFYKDNDERFVLYCKAALETLKHLYWQPDIIHCNDWQTSLVPFFLKTLYKNDPFFKNTATILTIHNPVEQGVFKEDSFSLFGVKNEFNSKRALFLENGKINFLKIGIQYADYINTVSERFAQEIQSGPNFGFGLEKLLDEKKNRLFGILSGVDYNTWNPELDRFIPTNYSMKTLELKEENKKSLLKKAGMPYEPAIPLIGYISRLTAEKGMDLFCRAIPELSKLNARFIILGTGERHFAQLLSQAKNRYPDKFNLHLTFNVGLAHLIEAGADMLLMPSLVEPCGINLLYSLKYGTIPIVRFTGGPADVVKDYNPNAGSGNGFVFAKYLVPDMVRAIKRAMEVYCDKNEWNEIMRNGMKENYSWSIAGKKYIKLYNMALRNSN